MSVFFPRLNKLSAPFSCSFPSETPKIYILMYLMVSHKSLKQFSLFSILRFSFCSSDWKISTALYLIFTDPFFT